MRRAAGELRRTLKELHFDESYAEKLSVAKRLKYLEKILHPRYISSGRHRFVYGVNGHYVVKIPAATDYVRVNTAEWNIFRKRQQAGKKWPSPIEPAKCCMVDVAGTKLLVMERLSKVCTPDNMGVPKTWPGWVHRIDCCQCGVSRDGRIVAFDYGTDGRQFRR